MKRSRRVAENRTKRSKSGKLEIVLTLGLTIKKEHASSFVQRISFFFEKLYRAKLILILMGNSTEQINLTRQKLYQSYFIAYLM